MGANRSVLRGYCRPVDMSVTADWVGVCDRFKTSTFGLSRFCACIYGLACYHEYMKTPNKLRLCRPDDNGDKSTSHYWDDATGQSMPAPSELCYTPEALCPEHRRAAQTIEPPRLRYNRLKERIR
jgi:hypothetical protein